MSSKDNTFRIKGGRIGVLLIHGLAGTPLEMRYVANGLGRAGYTVLCPQLAGHCGSDADLSASTWQDWYDSCERALDDLRETCDFVMTGGLSTGALLALMLAAKRPDAVQATALLAPTLWINGWSVPWYARLFRLVRHKWFANLIQFPEVYPNGIKDPRTRDVLLQGLSSADNSQAGHFNTPGSAVIEHRWLVDALKPLIGAIAQPTMILHPREDDLSDISNAWYLQRHLKGRVDMSVLEDSYHHVALDRQRHIVVRRTVDFVRSVTEEMAEIDARAELRAKARAALHRQLAVAA
ncbi:MAG: alpha/beta hydrolase [Hyphomicrobiaceae bacterium]